MKRFSVLIGLLVLMLVPLFSQDPVEPTTLLEWLSRFPEMVGSFWGCVVSAVFLTPVLLGVLKLADASKVIKYIFTGVVVVVLTVLATVLDFGYLNNAKLWFVIVNAVFIYGAQIFGYAALKPFLDKIAEKFNPWKPVQ